MSIIRQQQFGLTLIVIGATGAIAYIAHHAEEGWLDGATASWAQALFTVVAVGASALVAQWPIQAERDRQRSQRAEFLDRILSSVSYVRADFKDLDAAIEHRDVDAFKAASKPTGQMGQHIWGRYLKLPIESWPSIDLYVAIKDAQESTADCLEMARAITSYIAYPESMDKVITFRSDVTAALSDVEREVASLSKRK